MEELLAIVAPVTRPTLIAGTVSLAMAGWWCQLWRYPAFRTWAEEEFRRKHAWHTFQISLLVVPGALAQLVGTVLLCVQSGPIWLKALHVICLTGSLGPTFGISAPIHGRLSVGKDKGLIERLIATNLPRTLFWTVQAILAVAFWRLAECPVYGTVRRNRG